MGTIARGTEEGEEVEGGGGGRVGVREEKKGKRVREI